MRDGTFTDDFRPGMERERRALESTACGTYGASPTSRRNVIAPFVGDGGERVSIMPDVLASLINDALKVGSGRLPMKELAEQLKRFGVRRKA